VVSGAESLAPLSRCGVGQMVALASSLDWLRSGVPLFVFPEGTRSRGGRLGAFKLGAFKVAVKAGVPIVPVSISGSHLVMPPSVIMPHRPGRGITTVHIHPPIPTMGRSEKELADAAFEVINAALPLEQKSLPVPEEGEEA
jgi:1-acyl-sn-glycerol-3-phosphate acyltransferase